MTPETYDKIHDCFLVVLSAEFVIIFFFILVAVGWAIYNSMVLTPEAIHYIQNCSNLTLYPEGCQVLS